jgi:hypothetical protein
MGKMAGSALLVFVAGIVLLVTLVHVVFSLPVWLLLGAAGFYLWYRSGSRRRRLGTGNGYAGYLGRHSRW